MQLCSLNSFLFQILEPRFKPNTQPISSEQIQDIATTASSSATSGRTEILKLRNEQFWNMNQDTNLNFPPFLSQQQQQQPNPIVQQNTTHPLVNSKEDSLLEELLNLTNNHDNYQHSTPTTLSLTSM